MRGEGPRPPGLAERLLLRVTGSSRVGASVVGDLREEYVAMRERRRRLPVDAWYWAEALYLTARIGLQRLLWRSRGETGRLPLAERTPRGAAAICNVELPDRSGRRFDQPRYLASAFVQDLRMALRILRRNPLYAASAILALALGIGATTTVFSLVNWVLLRPVPGVTEPGRLATLRFMNEGGAQFFVPHLHYVELRKRTRTFDELAAYTDTDIHLVLPDGEASRVSAQLVTGSFFDVLGLEMAAGRGFTEAEGSDPGSAGVAAVSHRLASRLFSDPAEAVGSTLLFNGNPFVVIGVAARGFLGPELPGKSDVWVTVAAYRQVTRYRGADPLNDVQSTTWLAMVGRLRDGVTVDRAAAEMPDLSRQVVESFGGDYPDWLGDLDAVVNPGIGATAAARNRARETLQIMMVAAVLLLLLACADVANLSLARAIRRSREVGVRRQLGASRARLLGQLLVESSILGLGAGALAILLARLFVGLFRSSHLVSWLPELGEVALDARVLAFTAAVSLLAGIAFGAVPALRLSRRGATRVLGRDRPAGHTRTLDGLVILQLALSIPLLIGAGLLLRTVLRLQSTELGFDPARVLTMSVDPSLQGYDDDRSRTLYRELYESLGDVAGVQSVGLASPSPFLGAYRAGDLIAKWGEDVEQSGFYVDSLQITPGFFSSMGIPLVEGSDFTASTLVEPAQPGTYQVILSENLARELFPQGPAVGRRIGVQRGPDTLSFEIFGVAADARFFRVHDEPPRMLYEPFGQRYFAILATFLMRTDGDPRDLVSAARAAVAEIDPTLPPFALEPLGTQVESSFASERLLARLSGTLAIAALLLAVVGVYGVVSTTVRSRSRELAIRIAVGAEPAAVQESVLRRYLVVGGAGVVIGLFGTLWLTSSLEGVLFGVSRIDAATFATAAGLMLLATLVASLVPARRASRLDPVLTLRGD